MLFLPWLILLASGIFLLTAGESPKEEDPEKELADAIAKYLAKSKGNASQE
jgi:hypothetical protein